MVAIQVLPLEPRRWPESDEGGDDQRERSVRHGRWRTLPDRATRLRRRRLGALVSAVAVAGAVFALVDVVAGGPSAVMPAEGNAGAPAPIVDDVYVVQPGDTLWSIAERVAPGADPRTIVAELREITGGVELDVGDRVPVGDL